MKYKVLLICILGMPLMAEKSVGGMGGFIVGSDMNTIGELGDRLKDSGFDLPNRIFYIGGLGFGISHGYLMGGQGFGGEISRTHNGTKIKVSIGGGGFDFGKVFYLKEALFGVIGHFIRFTFV